MLFLMISAFKEALFLMLLLFLFLISVLVYSND